MSESLAARHRRAKTAALPQLADWLATRFREEIEAEKWPALTPPQVRDIVATGELRDSQTVTVVGDQIHAAWGADHSTQTHDGGVTVTGARILGRPWTHAPLEELPNKFGELMDQQLRNGT